MNSFKKTGLKYKYKGENNPQGRPRVYFGAHPDDYSQYLDSICEEIWEVNRDAVIWYWDEGTDDFDEADRDIYISGLEHMQLFVFPITELFLYTKNTAREFEFTFAIEKHIPVLPLMQQSGLEFSFNQICGDMQFLDKNAINTDLTAIPYKDRFKQFVESVIIGNDLIEKIKQAFKGYIFLSYRKKDRKYAQEIMHLIHQIESCRDIAIWYDEFLVPGENFMVAIKDAIIKSNLFALVLTPNIIEPDNYVMAVEYPLAIEESKVILPIEATDIEGYSIASSFSGLEKTIKTDNELADYLEAYVAKALAIENNQDPEHLFFIGLAYLSGIDVETNHSRALSLIEQAADGGIGDAYKKIISMYENGEGVSRDYNKAAEWQEKYAYWAEDNLDSHSALWAFICAGDKYQSAGRLEKARDLYLKVYDNIHEQLNIEVSVNNVQSLFVAGCSLGLIYFKEVKYEEAWRLFNECLNLAETHADIINGQSVCVLYSYMGELSREEGRLVFAKAHYLRMLDTCKKNADKSGNYADKRHTALAYHNMGVLCSQEGKIQDARGFFQESLRISKELAEVTGNDVYMRDVCICYQRIAELYQLEGQLEIARKYYIQSLEITKALVNKIGTLESKRNMNVLYCKLGEICMLEDDMENAKRYFQEGLSMIKAIAKSTKTVESLRDLCAAHIYIGSIALNEGNYDEAKNNCCKVIEIGNELIRKGRVYENLIYLVSAYSMMGSIVQQEGNYEEIYFYYSTAIKLYEEIQKKVRTLQELKIFCELAIDFGDFLVEKGNLKEAKYYFQKGFAAGLELVEKIETDETIIMISIVSVNMGDVSYTEGNFDDAHKYYHIAKEYAEKISNKCNSDVLQLLEYINEKLAMGEPKALWR